MCRLRVPDVSGLTFLMCRDPVPGVSKAVPEVSLPDCGQLPLTGWAIAKALEMTHVFPERGYFAPEA